jgi:hypothetical protein
VYRVLLGKVQTKGDELAFNSIRMARNATAEATAAPEEVRETLIVTF